MPSLLIPALNEFNWTINSISRNNLTFRYEPLQPLLLLEMLNDVHGDVFFDIGSNIGLYTIMMSTSESLQNIYSYEPAQDTYVELEANIKLNNLSNIATPYCLGVSSSDGTFNFQIESPLSGINSIVDTSFHNKDLFHEFTEIKTVALDNCHHLESKTLVFKIDVEGHEYEVLKGAKNLLSKNMCILQIEIMEKHLKNCQNILTSLGYYEIFKIKNDHYFTNISYKDRIINIFERKNELIRPAVANIDQALVVFAAAKPSPHFNLLDRFLVMMQTKEIPVILCFNKEDIASEEKLSELAEIYEKCGCQLIFVSAKEEKNMETLRRMLEGKTTAIAGPSGVGKSSIINFLNPKPNMETGSISRKIERGKHTTRHSELFMIGEDSYIMDTPGYDIACNTAMIAGGCQMIAFTTGRGTPTGHAIAPIFKITGNRATFERMKDNIEVDVSALTAGEISIEQAGEIIYHEMMEIIEGKLTKAETYGFSDTAIDRICRFI